MASARLAAQDFTGASHFKALGYRLFRLTSSDRFWHKEPVKYASPNDSQGQNDRLIITIECANPPAGTDACHDPPPGVDLSLLVRPLVSAAARANFRLAEDADCLSKKDHDDRPYN
jgi:hypothetical protein